MKKVLVALPLWGAFFSLSCAESKPEEPEALVRMLYANVIYGKDRNTCIHLLYNHVYLNVFQGQLIKLTKKQAEEVCDGYIDRAKKLSLFPTYGIKDFKVQVTDIDTNSKLAGVVIIMQDGRSEPAGNIKLFKKDNRWYMEY